MPKSIHTIAQSIRESPRLASIQDPATFQKILKTRYNSEIDAWLKEVPKDSWKKALLENEKTVRELQKKIQALEAELW